ncbi:alpha/beta fold hydrolase [Plantactinospora solaniradicis]|uniref:Alpha/beta fold hydrolase n=1 Tax=Plantactinospora solaniradicis TaxID=1723736 RepID=A0ABW1K921_9ACTN
MAEGTLPAAGELMTALGPVGYTAAGRGPVAVLLHGNPGDARDWDAVVDVLAERRTVVRLDWPGYGRSSHLDDGATVDAPGLARVLDDVLDGIGRAVGGRLGQVVLIGHSVGGYTAAYQALARPDRVAAVVLVAPGGFTRFTWLTRTFVRTMGSVGPARLLAGPLASAYTVRRTPTSRAALRRVRSMRGNPDRLTVHSAVWRSFLDPAHDLRHIASTITVPVLLTWGRLDPVVPWRSAGRRAARLLPRAQVARFWSGHLPHAEVPQRWLGAVVPFLDAVAPPPCAEASAPGPDGANADG